MHDIAIVGGGPGGLYAAAELASAGLDVVVFEEHPWTGEPVHCTGVLAVEAFDEFRLDRGAILNSLTTARFVGPSGHAIEHTTPTVEAVAVDRRAFDAALGDRAVLAGAALQVGTRVVDVQALDRHVLLTHANGDSTEARAVVLACGANYALQRRLGMGVPDRYLQTAQIEVPARHTGPVELHFGGDVAPRGFAWVVPVRRGRQGFARIGLMCDRDARGYFDRFLARVGPRWQTGDGTCRDAGQAPRSKILPLAPIDRTYAARIVAVGDAAGLVKATTGGGIYYSLLSGKLAAEVLTDALRTDNLGAGAMAAYERRWRVLLGDELAAQRTLRDIADRLSDDEIDELFELARTDGIMPLVRRHATFNRHRALILSLLGHPPARRVLLKRALGWGQTVCQGV